MGQSNRNAWTPLETIVVGIVVAVLGMLAIAAISIGRERARRAWCQDNLRQLGVGLQSYHQANGILPPAAIRDGVESAMTLKNVSSSGVNDSLQRIYANWVIHLLPHLGQDELAKAFNVKVPVYADANRKARLTELPLMACGSDYNRTAKNQYLLKPLEGEPAGFARGNYAINGGLGDVAHPPGRPWDPSPNGTTIEYTGDPQSPTERVWSSGIAGYNKSFSVDDFKNGLSNLVGIDEVRAGLTEDDVRGVWALGVGGASVTWGHGIVGDSPGPNCPRERSDDTLGCYQLYEKFGMEALIQEGMPCCPYARSGQSTARSMHPGGVNALIMDGSARFISDNVDLSVWHALHSRETRETAVPVESDAPTLIATASAQPESFPPEPEGAPSITNALGMRLVRIPPGEFIMGLPDEGENTDDPISGVPHGVPPHRVRITKSFYLGAFEVTQLEYERVMGRNPSWHSRSGEGKGLVIGNETSQFPVEQVSWIDAAAFCCRLSAVGAEKAAGRRYRLPTEAEWEYACRAGNTKPFVEPTEEEADAAGFNVRADSNRGLPVAKVGSYPPNPFGLFDMRGNVQEWCADWYAWDYYAHSAQDDPPGPSTGVLRMVRGADWRFTGMGCHYSRYETEPWRTSPYIGFRVVCELR